MGRSRCLAFVSLLLLVPSLFFSPTAATAPHADVVATFGGRRSLLQTAPPTPAVSPPTPAVSPPTPAVSPPTPAANPPTPAARPPTPAANPPTPTVNPPTPVINPPTPAANPPTPTVNPPTPGPRATAPTPAGATSPTPVATPVPAPFIAPAPAPIGTTSRQRLNAAIAGGVVGSVILIAIVLIFCRCHCMRREKRMPFQRLQMT